MSDQRQPPALRAHYPHLTAVQTRWMDNDVYGHINNVTYYSYFDSVVNRYLIHPGGLDIHDAPVVGFVVESNCRYLRPFAYPEEIEAGLRIGRLGGSSARYELALFAPGEERARAEGYFVHVFVDRRTQRPAPIPAKLREALAKLVR